MDQNGDRQNGPERSCRDPALLPGSYEQSYRNGQADQDGRDQARHVGAGLDRKNDVEDRIEAEKRRKNHHSKCRRSRSRKNCGNHNTKEGDGR